MSIGWKSNLKKFVTSFVWNNGGFESIYFTFQLFYTIGISKHTNVISIGDIGLDIMKLETNCNCVMDAF